MGFRTLVPDEVSNEWGWIQPLFKQAVKKSGTPDDLDKCYLDCLNGDAFLGINDDRTTALLINIHPDVPGFLNWHYTGSEPNVLNLEALKEYLYSFNRYQTQGIIAGGRRGWIKKLEPMGFEVMYKDGKHAYFILKFTTGDKQCQY